MLEYFSYKKIKKHRDEKKLQTPPVHTPLLKEEDVHFLERIVSSEGTPPPLPNRPHGLGPEAGDATGNTSQLVVHDPEGQAQPENTHSEKGKGKETDQTKTVEKDKKKANRFSFLRGGTKAKDGLSPQPVVTPNEASKEEDDISKILDELNLSAINNRAFSISKESQELVQAFTVILKDLVNGVPTAYDDLVHLLDNSSSTLSKNYENLPSFLQKLITQLPNKLTSNLAPELLAVATEAQSLNAAGASSSASGGIAGAAKKFLTPTSLKDLVTKPGAVVSLLKAIMNALKLRWPAFMGTNVLLSLGLFVLLFVFWYCHKRGREVRLEREAVVDSDGRIIEVEDDPMLAGVPGPSGTAGQGQSSGVDHTNPQDGHLHIERRSVGSERRSTEKPERSRSREHETVGGRKSNERH